MAALAVFDAGQGLMRVIAEPPNQLGYTITSLTPDNTWPTNAIPVGEFYPAESRAFGCMTACQDANGHFYIWSGNPGLTPGALVMSIDEMPAFDIGFTLPDPGNGVSADADTMTSVFVPSTGHILLFVSCQGLHGEYAAVYSYPANAQPPVDGYFSPIAGISLLPSSSVSIPLLSIIDAHMSYGYVQLWAIDEQGSLHTTWAYAPGDPHKPAQTQDSFATDLGAGWVPCYSVGNGPANPQITYNGAPLTFQAVAAAARPSGHVQVFGVGHDSKLYTATQTMLANGTSPTGPSPVFACVTGTGSDSNARWQLVPGNSKPGTSQSASQIWGLATCTPANGVLGVVVGGGGWAGAGPGLCAAQQTWIQPNVDNDEPSSLYHNNPGLIGPPDYVTNQISTEIWTPVPSGSTVFASPDWRQFRSDAANSGGITTSPLLTDAMIPTSPGLSASPALTWSAPMNGRVIGTPSVVNGIAYLPVDHVGVTAIGADGSTLWSQTKLFPAGTSFSSTAVAFGMVFVHADDGNLYALKIADGSKAWTYPTGQEPGAIQQWVGQEPNEPSEDGRGFISSPTVDGDTIFVGAVGLQGGVHAVDATSGQRKWFYPASAGVYSTPALAYGNVFVGLDDGLGSLVAINSTTGAFAWSFVPPAAKYPNLGSIMASVACADGKIYYATYGGLLDPGAAVATFGAVLFAVDASSHSETWSFSVQSPIVSSPAVVNGRVYVATYNNSNEIQVSGDRLLNLFALDWGTGAPLWSRHSIDWIVASPIVANGLIAVCDTGGWLRTYDVLGDLYWEAQVGSQVVSSPVIASNGIYVATSATDFSASTSNSLHLFRV